MNKRNKLGLAFLLGAVAGGVAAIFMPDDKREKSKKVLTKQSKKIYALLTEHTDLDKLKAKFPKNSEEMRAILQDAQEQVATKLDELKLELNKIDKRKYKAVVGDVVKDFKKQGKATADQMSTLQSFLLDDFKKLNKAAKEDSKKA